ncbi:MAG: hypothetical protein RIB64_00280 [Arenibacter algicola]
MDSAPKDLIRNYVLLLEVGFVSYGNNTELKMVFMGHNTSNVVNKKDQ